ncbi:MAG: HAMP domain-containing sensor histidine kinase [Cytophagales bacterium]|nr:HAMP domain-containing sensor histidine kinase [Cytophagales bacterium]
MNKVYQFFGQSFSPEFEDWHKRKVLIHTLVLSLLFLLVTSLSFFLIDFKIASAMGFFGALGTVHVAFHLKRRHSLLGSVNLLAMYANIMFLVEVIFSGGISSPALYWLMCSPFFSLIFSDYEVNRNSALWIALVFFEFIVLFICDAELINLLKWYPLDWHETLVLVFAVTFMSYCSGIILMDVKFRKDVPVDSAKQSQADARFPLEITSFDILSLSRESLRLHRRMIWITIILVPIFPDAFFFDNNEWRQLFSIRIGLILYFIVALYSNFTGKLSGNALAYLCLVPLVIFLSYVSSMVPVDHVLMYNINYSAVFIISSFFLLWHWGHSLALGTIALVSYVFFAFNSGRLSLGLFVEDGAFLLFSIAFAGIWLSRFRYQYFLKENALRRELESNNKKLSSQNNELKLLNNQLKRSEEKQKQSSLIKDKLFSIISHDLRSPIGTVTGFIRILNDDSIDLDHEKMKGILGRLETSLKNVELLIDNLLSWARSQMGILTLRIECFDLKEVSRRCVDLFGEDLKRKNLKIQVKENTYSKVYADMSTIEFVIRNLLANAIKFSNPGGAISIEFEGKEGYLFVSIIDQGVGMSEEEVESLLDPNTHFTKPGTDKEMGTGLGVQLCVDFVKKNKGEFLISSEVGSGSTFTFSIPIHSYKQPDVEFTGSQYNLSHN